MILRKSEVQRLLRRNPAVVAGDGTPGVQVSLQFQTRLSDRDRNRRRQTLSKFFDEVAHDIRSLGAVIDLQSVSVSGQTVTAVFPVKKFTDIEFRLRDRLIRVDPIERRQIV